MKELSSNKTMTVSEISEALNVPKRTIINNIKYLYPNLMKHGKVTYLNEVQVTAVKMSLETKHNSASTGIVAKTDLEMMMYDKMVSEWKDNKIKTLENENEEMKPKAIAYDQFLDTSRTRCLSDVAKMLGMKPQTLTKKLRADGVLFYRGTTNLPFNIHIDKGRFEVKETLIRNGASSFLQTRVTALGVDYITKKYKIAV